MFKMIKSSIIIMLFASFTNFCGAKKISLTVPYNNVPFNEELRTAWGISVFVEGLEKSILFDTGGDGSILLSNMKELGIKPTEVELVVLSHIHGDHVGGLEGFLKENNKVTVYLPSSFPENFKNEIKTSTGNVLTVQKPLEICENAWSTGELGTSIKEQSLVIDTPKGLIVLTGCSHPGIINIVNFVKNYFEKEIYLVSGGFHLISSSETEIKKIIKELKRLEVKKIAPSHCTGKKATELFKKAWGKDFIEAGCGTKINISFNN